MQWGDLPHHKGDLAIKLRDLVSKLLHNIFVVGLGPCHISDGSRQALDLLLKFIFELYKCVLLGLLTDHFVVALDNLEASVDRIDLLLVLGDINIELFLLFDFLLDKLGQRGQEIDFDHDFGVVVHKLSSR